jgi:16S rRNA C1402 N4-methylase RsmH
MHSSARTIVEARDSSKNRRIKRCSKYLPEKCEINIAQIYQAIRIEVNQEMDVLKKIS